MLISTTNNQQPYWKYHSLFDTDTGLRYTLMYKRDKYDKPEAYVDIEASTSNGEYDPLRYSGHEAVDFWLALIALTADSIVREQIRQSATAAAERLRDSE